MKDEFIFTCETCGRIEDMNKVLIIPMENETLCLECDNCGGPVHMNHIFNYAAHLWFLDNGYEYRHEEEEDGEDGVYDIYYSCDDSVVIDHRGEATAYYPRF